MCSFFWQKTHLELFPFPSGVILFLPLRETVLALSHPPLLMESKVHFKSLTVEWLTARNCVVFLNSLFLRNCLFSKEKLKFKVMNKSHVNCTQAWQLLSSFLRLIRLAPWSHVLVVSGCFPRPGILWLLSPLMVTWLLITVAPLSCAL